MGTSRYNKIYLGRRAMRLNMRQMQIAIGLGALALVGALAWLIAR